MGSETNDRGSGRYSIACLDETEWRLLTSWISRLKLCRPAELEQWRGGRESGSRKLLDGSRDGVEAAFVWLMPAQAAEEQLLEGLAFIFCAARHGLSGFMIDKMKILDGFKCTTRRRFAAVESQPHQDHMPGVN